MLRADGVDYDNGVETPSAADVVRLVRTKLTGRMDKLMMNHLLPGAKSAVWETIQKDEYRKHRMYRKSVDSYLHGHLGTLRVIFERYTVTGDGIFEKRQKEEEEKKKKAKETRLRREQAIKRRAREEAAVAKGGDGAVSGDGLTSLIQSTREGVVKQEELELAPTRAEEREAQKDFLKSVGSFYGPRGQTLKMQQAMLFRELAPHEQSLLQSLPSSVSRPIIALAELCGGGVVRAAAVVGAAHVKNRLVQLGVDVHGSSGGGTRKKKRRRKRTRTKRRSSSGVGNETTIVQEEEEEEERGEDGEEDGAADSADSNTDDEAATDNVDSAADGAADSTGGAGDSSSSTSRRDPPGESSSKMLMSGGRCHVKAISYATNMVAEEVLEAGAPPVTFPSSTLTQVDMGYIYSGRHGLHT
jgi:hypothetical protein